MESERFAFAFDSLFRILRKFLIHKSFSHRVFVKWDEFSWKISSLVSWIVKGLLKIRNWKLEIFIYTAGANHVTSCMGIFGETMLIYAKFLLFFNIRCVKNVRIRIFSVPYFPAFGMWENSDQKTPNMDNFNAVIFGWKKPFNYIFHQLETILTL